MNQPIPYVYIIEEIATGIRYIGSRRQKGCSPNELLVKYFTSSRIIQSKIKQLGQNIFRIVYIKEFSDAQSAINHETELINKFDAVLSTTYYNLSNQGEKFHVKDHIWITNGKSERYHLKNLEIPVGWRKGRIVRGNRNTHTGIRRRKITKDGVTKSVKLTELNIWLETGWIIGDATNTSKDYMWITNGEDSKYVSRTATVPAGWNAGRTPLSIVNSSSRYKLASARSNTIITPHFCAVSVASAIKLYAEYYDVNVIEHTLLGKSPISKNLLYVNPKFCELFGITHNDIGKNIRDMEKIELVKGLWKTCH